MTRNKFIGLVLGIAALPSLVYAKVMQEFSPKLEISDGKDGRVFKKWVQPVKESAIHEVRAKLYRKAGGDNTYVNLRFGEDGDVFESGRRVYLKTDDSVVVTFKLGNQRPNGKPLVMNAYNGTVLVRLVTIRNDR